MATPSILFITADEMRADATGFGGNPDCRTPHLDTLAAGGVCFRRHFAVFPKCVPSRISMLTGRYTHTGGQRTVMGPDHLPKGSPNLVSHLRQNGGYETAVFGLNHVWDNEWFYDFGKADSVVDYHSFATPELDAMAKQARPYPVRNPNGPHPIPELQFIGEVGCVEGEKAGFFDENRTDNALHYLRKLRDPAKPFYLQLNLSLPHPDYKIHEPYYSMYDRESLTPYPYDLPHNAPLPLRAQREHRLGKDVPEAWLREIQAIYYGMCTFIDDEIGRLLACLDDLGLRDNTFVGFCSDHGDYAGQYGVPEKWDTDLRDCLLHVPMVLAGPGLPKGKSVDGLTEHVDLPPTFFELLGLEDLPPEWNWHGESLMPAIESGKGKAAVFADGGHEAAMRGRFNSDVWGEKSGLKRKNTQGKQAAYAACPEAMARAKMVRTEEWKLVVREGGDDELYHLPTDPCEMANRIGEPGTEPVVNELQRKLLDWCLRTDPDLPFHPKVGA